MPGNPREDSAVLKKKELQFFHEMLLQMKAEILEQTQSKDADDFVIADQELSDEMDLASSEGARTLNCKIYDRSIRLLHKIEDALVRIEEGEFGLCEECGEEIGIRRLQARPVATRCIECKEEQERQEKCYSKPTRDHESMFLFGGRG